VRLAEAGDWGPAGVIQGMLGGSGYYAHYYDLRPGLSPTGGTLLTNGDREQRYLALTLGWNKRLQERWSSRAHLTWQDWTWRIGPNYTRFADPTLIIGEGQRNGAPVAEGSGDFGAWPVFLNSRWAFDASAMVQLPWIFNFALELDARQGFPVPYFQQAARYWAGPAAVQPTGRLDNFRYDNLFTVDARLDRELALTRDFSLTLSLAALNLLDAGTVLRREANLGVTRARFADEVLAPRVLRIGLDLAFR
jgi:hypothetical protein